MPHKDPAKRKARKAAHRAANKEKINASRAKLRAKIIEGYRAQGWAQYAAFREKESVKWMAYKNKNKEKERMRKSKYRSINRVKIRERAKASNAAAADVANDFNFNLALLANALKETK